MYFVFNCFVFCILYLKAFPNPAFAINFFPRVSQQSHSVSQHILFCQIISPRHVQLCTASLTMGVKAMLPQVNWCLCSGDVQCVHMMMTIFRRFDCSFYHHHEGLGRCLWPSSTYYHHQPHYHHGHGHGHHHNRTHHHHHHHVGRSFGWGAGVALGEVQPRCKVTCSVAYSSTYSTFSSYRHHYFMTHHHQNSFKEYDLLKETIMICWRNLE